MQIKIYIFIIVLVLLCDFITANGGDIPLDSRKAGMRRVLADSLLRFRSNLKSSAAGNES